MGMTPETATVPGSRDEGAGASSSSLTPELSVGQSVGRYRLCAPLGAGSMGVVYEAFDPELERKVALKLLHPSKRNSLSSARMLREARALARLDHPNVVTILDVGRFGSQVFLAMDFVEGKTLTRWLLVERPVREILKAFVAAGRGLAAAHAKGLVHRDFKPDNVMMSRSGEVVVTDFGLVAAAGVSGTTAQGSVSDEFDAEPPEEVLSRPLTVTGRLLGTPAYMAPEQFGNEAASPAADQYSFCVSLFEALYGHRPRSSDEIHRLACEPHTAQAPKIPRNARVPEWLSRALERGLQPSPADRWPSMDHLLWALEHADARRSGRRKMWAMLAGAGVLVMGLGGSWQMRWWSEPCSGSEQQMREVWGPQQRARVVDTVAARSEHHARTTVLRVQSLLDEYAGRWAESHRRACLATRVEKTQTEPLMMARMRCLERRRHEFASLVETLSSADAGVIDHALDAVVELSPIEPCSEPTYVLAQVVPPSDDAVRRRVDEIRHELARSWALRASGKLRQAEPVMRELLAETETLEYEPIRAQAELELGTVLEGLGKYEQARVLMQRAFFRAVEVGMDDVAADAAIGLTTLTARGLRQGNEARRWLDHADARVDELRDQGRTLALEAARGDVLLTEGDFAEAQEVLSEVYEARRSLLGDDDPLVVTTMLQLVKALRFTGQFDTATRLLRGRLETIESRYGENHPLFAYVLEELGAALLSRGELEAALPELERALRILIDSFGEGHPHVGRVRSHLGAVYAQQGDVQASSKAYERAVAVFRETLGEEHPYVAAMQFNLGCILLERGHYEPAYAVLTQSLTAFESNLGGEHPHVGLNHSMLGFAALSEDDTERALKHAKEAEAVFSQRLPADHPHHGFVEALRGRIAAEAGQLPEAERAIRRALELREKAIGSRNGTLAPLLSALSEVLSRQERFEEARGFASRALSLAEEHPGKPWEIAYAQFALARALVEREPVEAEALVARARAGFERSGEVGRDGLRRLEAWLRERER